MMPALMSANDVMLAIALYDTYEMTIRQPLGNSSKPVVIYINRKGEQRA